VVFLDSRCQFHQHFYARIFRMNAISAAFSSYMYVEKWSLYEKFVRLTLMKLTPGLYSKVVDMSGLTVLDLPSIRKIKSCKMQIKFILTRIHFEFLLFTFALSLTLSRSIFVEKLLKRKRRFDHGSIWNQEEYERCSYLIGQISKITIRILSLT